MFDPENRVGWRARWIARDYRLVYTYGEHLLLALLEDPAPDLAAILAALGEEPEALRAEVRRLADGLAPARWSGSGYGEADEIENAAWDFARAGGYYRETPAHLLLAMAGPLRHGLLVGKTVKAGTFLQGRGIKRQAIRPLIRPPRSEEQEQGLHQPRPAEVMLGEGWKAAAAEFRFDSGFRLSQYEFRHLKGQLLQAGEWAMLAHLHETLAASELLAHQSAPEGNDTAGAARHLIMAALWLRKAGDRDRARLIAERAIHELRTVQMDGRPNPEVLATPIDVAFAFEMMGDAALCIDPNLARRYWLRAREEFQYVDPTTQCAEWNEPWCHGWYLEEIHRHLLLGDRRDYGADGETRIDEKLEQWSGLRNEGAESQ